MWGCTHGQSSKPTTQSVEKQSFEPKNGTKRKRAGPPNSIEDKRDEQPVKLKTSNDAAATTPRNTSSSKAPKDGTQTSNGLSEKPLKRQKPESSPQAPRSSHGASQPSQPSNKTSRHRQHSDRGQSLPPHLLRKRDELLPVRKALPIWPQASAIKAALKKNNILVLTGETGSGKSTQVPQFLMNEPWCTKCIAITQPRRVAAISLARRVAEEMGSFMGSQSPVAKVGYSVRFDNATGPNTKVKFLTEGMLLQEMLRDPIMSQYSAVVVDEVHERSVNVDLILGFLRNLVSGVETGGKSTRTHPLRVIVMSATADVESLVTFFEDGQTSSKQEQGAKNPIAQKGGAQTQEGGAMQVKPGRISTCFVEGRQYPVKTVYLPQPTQDWVESALKIIFQIHYKEPLPGDILVFLTGQDTIEGLEKLVNDYAEGMDKDVPKLLALPLFAALPQHAQQRIFQSTPFRTRKVILATNIAETSVTVPGVRFVVDCGKSKIKQFRNRLGLESLLVKPISKSAAIQRKGRAGREAPGQCYRLYTEDGYNTMEERTIPEILRCDLSQSILTMKARGVDDVLNFPFLDRPPREAMEKALLQLLHLQALTDTGTISDQGLKIAKFPLTPTLGRVLVEAAKPERDCLLDAIDIISALSVENVFLNLVTEERKEEAEEARRELYRREGDHLTLLVTVQRYAEERTDRKVWCEKHFVSHRAMQNVMNIRKQLQQQCMQLKLLSKDDTQSDSAPSEARSQAILECMLRGFIHNTARMMPDGSYKTLIGNQTVAIHPSSVLFGRKVEAIVFNEFLFTGKAWARGVSAVQLDWVSEVVEAIM
ncbi:pre-mRNA-splicing factor ATP-dependent RNA helicase PRP16 [Cucurbitaria berberidis CBS 394.84]|uniref:RNA helicase n=1 Tax=Cucurbitaria berberidis CBS 394.84 TaxID=1168544 RepID=A0A9P4GED6_9PLEO|nr:pre-mRNA-splicing factor ATP-dependent RNA helicase PRP16 [Cucurbitaria berberidis CBS 394.84]KAF1843714.1 pre-mRNA-splicing factor ATP-dependent RNA helicase PRP16 [Cucurbitaria berberidis CBS 394.84]